MWLFIRTSWQIGIGGIVFACLVAFAMVNYALLGDLFEGQLVAIPQCFGVWILLGIGIVILKGIVWLFRQFPAE